MSGEPFPHESHKCGGEPILEAWTHQAIRQMPGATNDEIVEKVLYMAGYTHAYDRRITEAEVRQILTELQRAEGARRILGIEQVREARARLPKGKDGERSIAKALRVSRSTVRRVMEDAGER